MCTQQAQFLYENHPINTESEYNFLQVQRAAVRLLRLSSNWTLLGMTFILWQKGDRLKTPWSWGYLLFSVTLSSCQIRNFNRGGKHVQAAISSLLLLSFSKTVKVVGGCGLDVLALCISLSLTVWCVSLDSGIARLAIHKVCKKWIGPVVQDKIYPRAIGSQPVCASNVPRGNWKGKTLAASM